MSYKVVVAAPATLLVYAAPVIIAPGTPLMGLSVIAIAPVSGLSLRFCPLLVTSRIRSTVGLKSNAAIPLSRAGVNADWPIIRVAPLSGLITYNLLSLLTP